MDAADNNRPVDPWSVGFGNVNELPPPPNQIENDADLFAQALDREITLPSQAELTQLNLFAPDGSGPLIHPDFQCEPTAAAPSMNAGNMQAATLHPTRASSGGVLISTTGSQFLNYAQSASVSKTQVQQRPHASDSVDGLAQQSPTLQTNENAAPKVTRVSPAITSSTVTTPQSTNSSASGTNKRSEPPTKPPVPRRKRARMVNSKEDEAALLAASSGKADLTPEEQKRIRRVKNRASVEKCRHRQRVRFDALTNERDTITKETTLLRAVGDEVRDRLGTILNQVAALSNGL